MLKEIKSKKVLNRNGIALGAAIKLANLHRQNRIKLKKYEYILLNIVDYFLYNKYISQRQLDTLKVITARYFDRVLKGKRVRVVSFKEFRPLTINESKLENIELHLHEFKGELKPFQETGVKFIVAHEGRGLIADVMGLGKTVQAIAVAQHFDTSRPVIVACPAVLKYNWANEIVKFVENPNVYIVEGYPNGVKSPLDSKFLFKKGDPKNSYVIINYDIIANRMQVVTDVLTKRVKKVPINNSGWVSFLEKIKPSFIILDEAHKLKNYKAARTRATLQVARKCKHIVALTGTPIISAPIDMYYILKTIAPNIVPPRQEFIKEFMKAKHNGFTWVYTGVNEKNLPKLKELLSEIMIRRTKEEIDAELLPKVKTVLPISLKPKYRKEYDKANENFLNWLKTNKGTEIKNLKAVALVKLAALREILALGKIDTAVDWIKDLLTTYPNKKLVVFSHHRKVIDELSKKLTKEKFDNVIIWGGLTSKQSNERITKFKEDKNVRVLIGSISAASLGLTLTVADTALFLELPWTSVDLEQAEDRIHRIGQTKKVNIYYFIAHKTVEERIVAIIDAKKEVINSVLSDTDSNQKDDYLLNELLEQMLNDKSKANT